MVNHARTLLLNMSASSLEALGFERGRPWVVDPLFRPVEMDSSTADVLRPLTGGARGGSMDDVGRVAGMVSAVCVTAMSPDLAALFRFIDSREVPVNPSSAKEGSVARMFSGRALSSGIDGVASAMVAAARSRPGLFSKVGRIELDACLSNARDVFLGSGDGTSAFSAVVAASLARMEHSRLSGRGV